MTDFLIKSTLSLAVFLAFYHLFLEREKMHVFNRFYLLFALVISLIIPFITIEIIKEIPVLHHAVVNNSVELPVTISTVQIAEKVNYMPYIMWSLYSLIALVLLIRFGKNIRKLLIKSKTNPAIRYQKAQLILVEEKIVPHTFLNSIFVNQDDYNTRNIEEELYTHELVHVTQKHTLDILFIELLKVIFWFNPLFILYKKAIQLNHEFLADQNVVLSHDNIPFYQTLLLKKSNENATVYLASNLNYLVTKKRLIMMSKTTSRTLGLLKKAAVIPVLAGLIYFFCIEIVAQEKTINSKSEIKTPEISDEDKIRDRYYSNVRIMIKDLITNTTINKMYEELTLEEKRSYLSRVPDMMIEKEVPEPLFEKMKTTNMAVWINGKVSSKEEIQKYKRTDFNYYTYSFVHKNARTKRFPQEYQYTLYTKKYFDENLKNSHLHFSNDTLKMIVSNKNKETNKISKILSPKGVADTTVWQTKGKDEYYLYTNDTVKKKKIDTSNKASNNETKNVKNANESSGDGYPEVKEIKIKGATCYYFTNKKNEIEYYNRWGFRIDKEGEIKTQYVDERNNGTKRVVRGQKLTFKTLEHSDGILVEQGYINKAFGTLFFIKKGENISYYTNFGEPCDKNGTLIKG